MGVDLTEARGVGFGGSLGCLATIALAFMIALVGAVFYLFARGLVRPIRRISKTARRSPFSCRARA